MTDAVLDITEACDYPRSINWAACVESQSISGPFFAVTGTFTQLTGRMKGQDQFAQNTLRVAGSAEGECDAGANIRSW